MTAALLQSPHFLYRSEIGVPDAQDPTRRRLTDYELASRLAYFLWGAPPDDQLLDAAAAGRLSTDAGPGGRDRAHAALAARPRDHGRLLRRAVPAAAAGPAVRRAAANTRSSPPPCRRRCASETLRLIEEVAFDPAARLPGDLLGRASPTSTASWPGCTGCPAPEKPEAFTAGGAAGRQPAQRACWARASFLAIFAHSSTSSPTRRGKFIREALLCQAVPPPPPSVETKLPKDEGDTVRTTRQKLEAHRKNPRCNGCHKAMDPLGLAFESFDGLGHPAQGRNGLPIDTSGELDGTAFTDPRAARRPAGEDRKIGACVARSLFRFALGSLESEGEEPLFEELARGLARDGYKFPALVVNVIKSEGFRYLSAPTETTATATATAQLP